MKYNTIKCNDTANGEGVCVSLYVQGCSHHCKGCFNKETWNFEEGKDFTNDTIEYIIKKINENNIIRNFSVLGGEPLHPNNIIQVNTIVSEVKYHYPYVKVFLWTGYKYEDLTYTQKQILPYVDVLIDGKFEQDKKDLTLRFCGSSNQKVIDVQKSLMLNKTVLYEE